MLSHFTIFDITNFCLMITHASFHYKNNLNIVNTTSNKPIKPISIERANSHTDQKISLVMSANATSRDLYLKISEATCISRAAFSLSTTCGQTLLNEQTNISDLTIEDGSRLVMNNTPRKETSVLTEVHKFVRSHLLEMLKSEVSDFFCRTASDISSGADLHSHA